MSGDGKGQSPGDGEMSPEDREAILENGFGFVELPEFQ